MTPLRMKTYLALLWGVSVLYAMESDMNASTTETSSISSIAAPRKPAESHVASPAETTVETKEAIATSRGDRAQRSASDLVAVVNTTAVAAHPSHNAMILEPANPREDPIQQQYQTASTDMPAPATASRAAVAVSSQQLSSTTKSEVTSKLPPITSPGSVQAPVFNQTHSVPSATTTMTARPTSEAAPVFDPKIRETFPTSTEFVSTPKFVSVTKTPVSTSQFPGTAGLSSTAESPTIAFSTESPISTTKVSTADVSTADADVSTADVSTTDVSTTDISTSPTGILIPREPNPKLPVPTTKSTPVTTTAPREVSKSPPSSEVQPCSNRRAMAHCLVAIASLAALATVFMVSTIILCTKLSKRKYKVKKTLPATEMMCISALLPERIVTYSRQRNPVTNGVLVIHDDADSDEDGGDNLTLSSFLPENDRFV